MLRNNKNRQQTSKKLFGRRYRDKKYHGQDFDAVSLYPSAQASCGGYPTGPAMKNEGLDW